MLLRRLATGAPLAVFVAVLAHVAGFGRGHAPGEGHAWDLLLGLAVALGTLAASVLLRSLVAAARGARPSRRSVEARASTRRRFASSVACLSGLAVLAFAAIELLEGHVPSGGSLRALAALVPLAALVAVLAPRAKHALRAFGERLGATLYVATAGLARAFDSRGPRRPVVRSVRASDRRRGRAPPLTA